MIRKRNDVSAVLIAGPTASGKSALALRLAKVLGGAVVNADSMQVYRGLEILGAQPTPSEHAEAPHRLYGHVDPSLDYSAGSWMRDMAPVLMQLERHGSLPIIVGGTGLYFRALLGGIDAMPDVPASIRDLYRSRMQAEGPAALHRELATLDPGAVERIRPSDPQRIVRALELVRATGKPLADIQKGQGVPLIDAERALKIVLRPERETLRRRIAERFEAMMLAGAIDEARRFHEGDLVAGATASKAIGLPELLRYLRGETGLDEAVDRAITRSRQYAKRQDTWFRHQLDDSWLAQKAAEALLAA